VNWFATHGHNVAVISDTPLEAEWPGIQIFKLPEKFNTRVIRFIIWEIWTRQIINRWRPDILHAHRVSSAGWLATFSGFHPFIVTTWGSDLLVHPNKSIVTKYLARKVIRSADLVTASSELLRNTAIFFGAENNQCRKISWGVDLSKFRPGKSDPLREELGVGNAPLVFCPRAIKPLYNIDTIIESIPLVIKSIPNVIYILQYYNVDPIYKENLNFRINELDIYDLIRWIPFQQVDRFVDYFRISDVVISVPSSDSIPVSVLEALACGKPVIVSDLPSLKEIIKNKINGLIVPVRDYQELATATINILKNPILQQKFYDYNIKWIQENANREIELKKMEDLYYSLYSLKKNLD